MRKKYLSALLFGALLVASAGTFTSCKDYDDDINNLQEQIDKVAKDLEDLKTKVDALGGVESIEFKDGQLIVHTTKGDVSTNMPECTGVQEVKLDGNTLYVDGEVAGKVELGEGGAAPVIEVRADGKLYVDGKVMDILVGDKVTILDNGETVTLTVAGQPPVELAKAGAAILSSIDIQDGFDYVGIEGTDKIAWGKAAVATPDWKGSKGSVKFNQLLIGQISTALVQVTPAVYDLAAHKLTLVDSRGNEAPVKVTPVKNNLLLSRSASDNGSWILSIEIDETQVNAGNIATAFKYDPEVTSSDEMAYTLCVDGVPYTEYNFSVNTKSSASTTTGAITNVTELSFVDSEGRVKKTTTGKLPIGTTPLLIQNDEVYDYYYTFEGTNISLAEQYGIDITEDGKSIIVPAGAEGVKIEITAHVMDINGRVSDKSANKVNLTIAGSEITAETLANTEHVIIPGKATEAIRVNFGDGEDNIFAKFPAAAREAVRAGKATIKVKEELTQVGFLIKSSTNGELNNRNFFKKDGTTWSATTDDLLQLSYMEMTVANQIADDATPGDYKLTFVAVTTGSASGDVVGNEIIKVNVPVTVSTPKFEDIFKKDASWNEAGDTYEARIIIPANTQDATLRYINAFEKNKYNNTGVNVSNIGIIFNLIDEEAPIDGGIEFETNNVKAVTIGINEDIKLDKDVVYNEDGNALKVQKLEGMRAYYNVFDGVSSVGNAVRQAFTVISEPFATKIVTALDGVEAKYYVNNVAQNVATLTADNSILGGSIANNKKNGLIFSLKGDNFLVKEDQFGASGDKLSIFNLYDNIATHSYTLAGNNVEVTFEDANGKALYWSNQDNLWFRTAPTWNTSVLNITFKDATGIEYSKSIKLQKPQ